MTAWNTHTLYSILDKLYLLLYSVHQVSCAAAGRHKIYTCMYMSYSLHRCTLTVFRLHTSCATATRPSTMLIARRWQRTVVDSSYSGLCEAHKWTISSTSRPFSFSQSPSLSHFLPVLLLWAQTIVVWAPARKGPQRSHGGFPAEIVCQNDGGRVWLLPPSVLCLCNCALHQRARPSLCLAYCMVVHTGPLRDKG